MNIANVKAIEQIPQSIADTRNILTELNDSVRERLEKADSLKKEADKEEDVSKDLLDAAIAVEEIARAALVAAEAALAGLIAASVAQPELLTQIPAAKKAVDECKSALEIAEKHRRLMEKRLEIVQGAVKIAAENQEILKAQLQVILLRTKEIAAKGINRLSLAYKELTGYSMTPEKFPLLKDALDLAHSYTGSTSTKYDPKSDETDHAEREGDHCKEYDEWKEHKCDEKKPVTPKEIVERLNPSKEACIGLLEDLYKNDPLFARTVSAYRSSGTTEEGRKTASLKIKKNMSGRLAEEIVRTALAPFGNQVETQKRYTFDDGSYTKTDLVVSGLKVPVILGKGEGMGAREGGSMAVEVKAGQGSYLVKQKGHLIYQAGGHADCDVSCVICTRDVKDLPQNVQTDLRTTVKEAGSPVLGMLPHKSWLDQVCEEFVFGV